MKELNKRVAGGMLPTVLIVSLLITLLSAALLGLAYFRNRLLARDSLSVRLSRNLQSGLHYLMANPALPHNQPYAFDLYGDRSDSVQVERRPWGLFDVAIITAFQGQHRQARTALLGKRPEDWGKAALYLADEDRPLALAGNTSIRGNCALPRAGVNAAYIEGRGYSGAHLVTGNVRLSTPAVPALPPPLLARIRHYQQLRREMLSQASSLRGASSPVTADFLTAPLLVAPQDHLIHQRMGGYITVLAKDSVVIAPSAQLDDVLVLARKVTVKAGFRGRLQILAEDTLTVEAGCHLTYPTVLSVYNQQGKCRLTVGSGCRLEGLLLVSSARQEQLNNVFVLAGNSTVEGQVYVDGLVELKGSIYGSLACRRFYLLTPGMLYENHLLDAELDLTKRSAYFLTSPLLSDASSGVLKWLAADQPDPYARQ